MGVYLPFQMDLDNKRKIKLLAIEEEITKLELELLVVGDTEKHLGVLFYRTSAQIRTDLSNFVSNYLKPVGETYTPCVVFEPCASVDSVLKFFKPLSNLNAADRLKYNVTGNGKPDGIWTGKIGEKNFYVMFISGIGRGKYYAVNADTSLMKEKVYEAEVYTEILDLEKKDDTTVVKSKQDALKQCIDMAIK